MTLREFLKRFEKRSKQYQWRLEFQFGRQPMLRGTGRFPNGLIKNPLCPITCFVPKDGYVPPYGFFETGLRLGLKENTINIIVEAADGFPRGFNNRDKRTASIRRVRKELLKITEAKLT